ncbi:hypothetical protein H2202_002183 [Exophiala xenobiotica]|nr:hypothetical protein H2202_002183 [Exophiala xenobiotica]KAK5319141.1 hypothetical protein LTR93_007836 [Exophiala xenobiotica]KAK5343111.1 hypothetical protein LTR98_000740 [Exophiala xenobiotica]KAK5373301.1 hypothetical protein LTR11_006041 [Exophiala xenobiotica]KAK5433461.1 hypothetical protein LTR18_010704 [Exophiala xenobiotica]
MSSSRGNRRLPPHADNPTQPTFPDHRNYVPDRANQLRQGEYYEIFDEERINIYKLVDSWRSYRNDTVNLQTSTTLHQPQWAPIARSNEPRYQDFQVMYGNAPVLQSSHARAPQQTLHEPLRSVHNYARYPTYRVDKAYRVSDGARDRHVPQQGQANALLTSTHLSQRYPLRSRRPEQIAAYSTTNPADVPLPSIEVPSESAVSQTLPNTPIRQVPSRRSRTATPGRVEPPPAPKPTSAYKKMAAQAPALRKTPQKLLVILDLNGTLLVRPNGRADPTKFKIRPGVTQLLDYLFSNHVVMVYSSARPENATAMVNNLIHPKQRNEMAAVWARDKLGLNSRQYNNKVQVYKKLENIWADTAIQSKAAPGCKWNQSNTVLVDDSQLKGLAQPHNLLQVPEFENNAPKEGGAVLREWQLKEQAIVKSLELKLEELKWQIDVSRLIREWQIGKTQAPGVVDETIDQKTHRRLEQPELTPAPSVGHSPAPSVGHYPAANVKQVDYRSHVLTPSSLARSDTFATEDEEESDDGVDLYGTNVLDKLEEEIDRNLRLAQGTSGDGKTRRSESPIDESVWKEILGTNDKKDKEKEKGSLANVPPTPESMLS